MTTRNRYCTHAARHWYAYYGYVGSSAPTCRHCGVVNPKYDADRDPFRDGSRCSDNISAREAAS